MLKAAAAGAVSVFNAAEDADFTFDGDAVIVGELDNLTVTSTFWRRRKGSCRLPAANHPS